MLDCRPLSSSRGLLIKGILANLSELLHAKEGRVAWMRGRKENNLCFQEARMDKRRMRNSFMVLWTIGLLLFSSAGCGSPVPSEQSQPEQKGTTMEKKLLVFSKTAGYRHESINDGIVAIRQLATEHGIGADFSEDAGVFTQDNLARYRAVIFLNTTGDILDANQQAAFEEYMQNGGGYVGVHSAADTEYGWTWYDQLVGTHFESHPQIAQATIAVEDHNHSSTSMLPATWIRTDEWYNFLTNPRPHVHVLLSLDETTYQGGTMGHDHPIAWYHNDLGRVWYTGLGHTPESFKDPLFLQHLWGGIAYAAALAE